MDMLFGIDGNALMLMIPIAMVGFGIWLVVKGYKVTGVMATIIGLMFLRLAWWTSTTPSMGGRRRR
jgi:hypothetical protein